MTIGNRARGSLLVPLCMVVTAWMGDAMAGTSECYAIKDADKRAYCLAQVKRDYGYCYRIKDGDNRNQCLAEIKGSRDRCYAIKDQDRRKACLARAISR
ncbi:MULTISPECIES: hypothetical protein [unclassified Simplicispira]|uniref:hypothetical protein n=1 Tax=unclassified Simplicispira TaxID=2630407 RepID=UPI000D5E64AA|nr:MULTISPECIES: hypothetical protein [unclassified Simplicispira]PVY56624.1 hypothetical protein C8D04_1886 [Simplicispira sp. 125]REG17569.1 hypothetical protein C8D01_2196 [Simplicispira sp. 110]